MDGPVETGCGAVLDGVSALQASGMLGFDSTVVHVSVRGGRRPRRTAGVVAHTLRSVGATAAAGVPRTSPEVAAVRAAQWATSDQQAALLLAMCAQQRLVRMDRLQDFWQTVGRSPRQALIDRVIRDVSDGAQALGELDFARMCRSRGLPEPSRQVVRRLATGRAYLDVEWTDLGVAVEIDGGHHFHGLRPVEDALRQNAIAADGTVVLRIPLLGLRLEPERFLDQVEHALRLARDRRATSPWRRSPHDSVTTHDQVAARPGVTHRAQVHSV
ncbi:hypothetical protein PZ938_05020 [Luteipulveratus sp. YIM 133132]|uniref:hypothetical protein n=1 Tax=Luteipulveratus flavus TaxID=3031728 RepID=UPI0023B12341|nr:hypothetical protein [Luteipulveratus sp. YIM 133132]MDE9364960.1 hypothetical protein [Luteipulveratus sp. YIM 133132]